MVVMNPPRIHVFWALMAVLALGACEGEPDPRKLRECQDVDFTGLTCDTVRERFTDVTYTDKELTCFRAFYDECR